MIAMALIIRDRQTFIALRARRQGYRIASEILNPPVKVEQVPYQPKAPIDPSVFRTEWVRRRFAPYGPIQQVLAWTALVVLLAYIVFIVVSFGHWR
jgi:hypothetical protein